MRLEVADPAGEVAQSTASRSSNPLGVDVSKANGSPLPRPATCRRHGWQRYVCPPLPAAPRGLGGAVRGATPLLAASPSAKNIAERCQPLAGGRGAERRHPRIPWASATTPAGVADPPTGSWSGTLPGCLSPRLSPGVSLSLNPRLMAGKFPACKVDPTFMQETRSRP